MAIGGIPGQAPLACRDARGDRLAMRLHTKASESFAFVVVALVVVYRVADSAQLAQLSSDSRLAGSP
jgi:hypothetical protein